MKFKVLIYKHFDTLETILLVAFAAGLMLLYQQFEYAKYIFASGSGAMAILYWFKAIERNSEEDNFSRYSQKFVWYGLMLTPAAIYSKINTYEKSDIFLIFAISLLVIALGVRIYQKIKMKTVVPNSDFFRIIIAIIIALSIFALPLPN
ncbi:MAG: hypothetical protein U9Q83_03695 [Bacteroidota bacterium]|nr:hypothetical protein [Bacteroidota bacterium]